MEIKQKWLASIPFMENWSLSSVSIPCIKYTIMGVKLRKFFLVLYKFKKKTIEAITEDILKRLSKDSIDLFHFCGQ